MDLIKIDDYVRLDNGKIFKVIEESEANYYNYIIKEEIEIYDNKIVKYSSNIIDLIQEGDYVNGELVREKVYLTNIQDINSIVTKELFKKCEYRLEC